jgi:hypothetical protein
MYITKYQHIHIQSIYCLKSINHSPFVQDFKSTGWYHPMTAIQQFNSWKSRMRIHETFHRRSIKWYTADHWTYFPVASGPKLVHKDHLLCRFKMVYLPPQHNHFRIPIILGVSYTLCTPQTDYTFEIKTIQKYSSPLLLFKRLNHTILHLQNTILWTRAQRYIFVIFENFRNP